MTPNDKARKEAMRYLGLSNQEYDLNKKDVENTLYFQGLALKHEIKNFINTFKNALKKEQSNETS